jgi:hypothetical protein
VVGAVGFPVLSFPGLKKRKKRRDREVLWNQVCASYDESDSDVEALDGSLPHAEGGLRKQDHL